MNAFFIEIAGPTIGPILGLAVIFALIVLAIWVAFLTVRRFRSGLFVSGGMKGRLPRLAVTDAVPVDSSRRLILVRRDDVEHLILIGGPTDIVVEAGIGRAQANVQPAAQPAQRLPSQAAPSQTVPQTLPQQRPPVQAAREAAADLERGRPVRTPETQLPQRRAEAPATLPNSASSAAPTPAPSAAPPVQAAAPVVAGLQTPPQTRPDANLDLDKLLDELRPNPLQDR